MLTLKFLPLLFLLLLFSSFSFAQATIRNLPEWTATNTSAATTAIGLRVDLKDDTTVVWTGI